jgi:hypothetical protein
MQDTIDDSEKLPPMWGSSYWWTRGGAVVGLIALLVEIVMSQLVAVHLGSCGLQNQLTNPTLAIEVARSWDDVLKIVGPCSALHCAQSKDDNGCFPSGGCQTICPDKIQSLAFEQTIDYVFIAVYWVFFLYLSLINWKFCYWSRYPAATQAIGKVCGVATIVLATLGAIADWRENDHILQAFSELHLMAGPVPLMRDFAYTKWQFLFFAISTAAPIFIFWYGKANPCDGRRSAFSQALAWLTAILALSTTWTGVAAHTYGDDPRLEVATERMGLVILSAMLTLATAQYWRGGTIVALNRFAKLPVLSYFATLFSSQKDVPQTPDIDPSRML